MMGNDTDLKKYFNATVEPNNISKTKVVIPHSDLIDSASSFSDSIDEYVKSLMGDIKGKKILEIGSGLGIHLVEMARKGAFVTGVDLSEERIKFAKELIAQNNLEEFIEVYVMDAENLKLNDDSFDIIYGYDVLMYFDGKFGKFLEQCKRLLKNDGQGIFAEPLKNNPFAYLYRSLLAPKEWNNFTTYLKFNHLNQFKEHFSNANFKTFYLFGFLSFYWKTQAPNEKIFKKLEKWLYRVDEKIMKILPFTQKFSWRIVINIRAN